jgi:hypothetical protein
MPPVGHGLPHAPQFCESEVVFVQVPLQSVGVVLGQVHTPATQVFPPLHFTPQPAGGRPIPEPQLLLSVSVFVQ